MLLTEKTYITFVPQNNLLLQRKCACGNHAGGGSCDECRKRNAEGSLRRAAKNHSNVNGVPQIVYDVLGSSGQSLDVETRSFMESRFDHDFSHVRVHTDDRAADSARAVHAVAYTVGNHIVFDSGKFSPHSTDGMQLLAHELTHVTQQSGHNETTSGLTIGQSNDAYEQEAENVFSHSNSHMSEIHKDERKASISIQRQEMESEELNVADKPKEKSDCSVMEKNLTSFAISIAHHHYRTEVKGSAPLTGIECSPPELCKATFADGVVVTVMMVEIPNKVVAGAEIGGNTGRMCDYSYRCPKGKPVEYTTIKCVDTNP